MKYILALVMHFRKLNINEGNKEFIEGFIHCLISIILSLSLLLFYSEVSAKIIDKVVAYVDDMAITLSEFKENYEKIKETVNDITEEEVINSMINRLLLIKKAKEMRFEAQNIDELIADYIDIKVKSSIYIKEDDVLRFYNEHIKEFGDKDYASVRDEIEQYLFELEVNKQLKKHLEELRKESEIRIQLTY